MNGVTPETALLYKAFFELSLLFAVFNLLVTAILWRRSKDIKVYMIAGFWAFNLGVTLARSSLALKGEAWDASTAWLYSWMGYFIFQLVKDRLAVMRYPLFMHILTFSLLALGLLANFADNMSGHYLWIVYLGAAAPFVYLAILICRKFWSLPLMVKGLSLVVLIIGGNLLLYPFLSKNDVYIIIYSALVARLLFSIFSFGMIIESQALVENRIHTELEVQKMMTDVSGRLYLAQLNSEFLHEIKNQLALLLNHKNLLALKLNKFSLAADHEVSKQITKMNATEGKILQLINEFGSLARGFAKENVDIEVDPFLQSMIETTNEIASSRGVTLVKKGSLANATLHVQKDQLEVVMLNLIKNAIEAVTLDKKTKSQGDKGLVGRAQDWMSGRPTVEIEPREDKEFVYLIVRDNGPGIPVENHEKIFEPKFTTKFGEATGLGLAISRKIVAGMSGFLVLGDRKDLTEFVVVLPKMIASL